MKKIGVISALALGLVLVSGCRNTTTQNGSSDVMSVYNEGNGEMTCTLTYTAEDEEGTSVIYVKDGMMKQDTTAKFEGEEYTVYTLAKDGTMYMWGDMYGDTAGFSMTYDFDIESELSVFDEPEEGTTISCVKGVKKDSVFNLPTDVEFTSMDELSDLDINLGEEDADLGENEDLAIDEDETTTAEEGLSATPVVEEVAETAVE